MTGDARELDASIVALLHRLLADCEAVARETREVLGLPAPPTAQEALNALADELHEWARQFCGETARMAAYSAADMARRRARALSTGTNEAAPVSSDVQCAGDSTGRPSAPEPVLERIVRGQL